VKKEREEMKRKLKSLKEAQEPLVRKIRSVESQLQPIEQQMREKVRPQITNPFTNHHLLLYIQLMPLFFCFVFRPPVSERCHRNANRNMISLNWGVKRFVLKEKSLMKHFRRVFYNGGSQHGHHNPHC